MPSQCTICTSPHGAAIDTLIRAGFTAKDAALQFGLSPRTVQRHVQLGHVAGAVPATLPVSAPQAPHVASAGLFVPTDPVSTFKAAFGYDPYPHQVEYLSESRNLLVLKSRQIGMSTAAAALAIHVARSGPGPDVVICSPTLRQSSEVAFRARTGLWRMGETLPQDAASVIRLTNGSRIVSVPGTARAVRGYSARLLIIDEGAFLEKSEQVFAAALPMVSATGGRVIVQSTGALTTGAFWELWQDPPDGWASMRIPADGILSDAEIEAARKRLSPADFAMEYGAEFSSGNAAELLWTEDQWAALIRTPEQEALRNT